MTTLPVVRVPAVVALALHAGRAVTVILSGDRSAPEMRLRHEIDLADPWVSESRHPYHQALGARGGDDVNEAVRRGRDAARQSALRVVHDFVRDMKSHGYEPTGAAIVVSSLVDGADVCGTHARAHAEEANLYRDVVEHALTSSGLDVAVFLDQALRRDAVEQLGDDAFVDTTLKRLSRVVGTPWRAPEKNASLAAWLILPAARRR